MGGEGSGRRPNPENIARNMAGDTDANISELPSQGKDLLSDAPNYGGIKPEARRDSSKVLLNKTDHDTDDLSEGSSNLYDKTVTLTEGDNVTITGTYPDFTIASTDTDTTYTAGTGLDLNGTEFSTNDSEIDHNSLTNTHNLTTDIDHNTITNTHNLTTDIDHNQLTNYDSDEHIDWTADSAGTIHSSNYVDNDTTYTGGTNLTLDGTTFNVDDAFLKNDEADTGVGLTLTGDNSDADTQYTAQVLYNTDETPPTASNFPIGTIYIQYTA